MTTVASGRWTSAPAPSESAIGRKPKPATRRSSAPARAAPPRRRPPPRARPVPRPRAARMSVTITTPLITAMPKSAMKPTDAERFERGARGARGRTLRQWSQTGRRPERPAPTGRGRTRHQQHEDHQQDSGTTTARRAEARRGSRTGLPTPMYTRTGAPPRHRGDPEPRPRSPRCPVRGRCSARPARRTAFSWLTASGVAAIRSAPRFRAAPLAAGGRDHELGDGVGCLRVPPPGTADHRKAARAVNHRGGRPPAEAVSTAS